MTDEREVKLNDIADAFVTVGCYAGGDKLTARMPVERHAAEYNMKHKNRGMALIFNHEFFDIPSLKARSGAEEDCKRLSASLKSLHFDVQVHKDKKLNEIQTIIEKVALHTDHTDNDCILVAILSHGEFGFIYAKDAEYKLDLIACRFTAQNCKSLAGKPKLFFIQTCQSYRQKTQTDGESFSSYRIPIHADFLVAYSMIPGSWFIQSLCKELNENGKTYDILTLLTLVCQQVAIDFESCASDFPKIHQENKIPCITTMLTRILRFVDKK